MSKKIFKDTFIFAIGNIFSKLTVLILLPFHTRILSTEKIGTIDIIITTMTIVLTLFSFNYIEGFLKFNYIKNDDERKKNYTNSFIIAIFSNFLFVFFLSFTIVLFKDKTLIFIILCLFSIQSFHQLAKQYTRTKSVKLYAIGDILFSFSFIVVNLITLLFISKSISAYFITLFIAYFLEWIFLFIFLKQYKKISLNSIDFNHIKKILLFSSPLILNSLLWWIINASDKYMLGWLIGLHASGVYVIASKFSAIINMMYSFFYNAWQINLYENIETNKSVIIKTTSFIFLILTILILLIINLNTYLVDFLFGKNLNDVKLMLPWMVLGVLFSCMSSMVGILYLVNNQSKLAMFSSLFCGIINLLLNYLLITSFGINGATIATMLSFILMFFYRLYDIKNRFNIDYEISLFLLLTLLLILLPITKSYFSDNIYLNFFINFIITILILINLFKYYKFQKAI